VGSYCFIFPSFFATVEDAAKLTAVTAHRGHNAQHEDARFRLAEAICCA
jgi:hypothetical protein